MRRSLPGLVLAIALLSASCSTKGSMAPSRRASQQARLPFLHVVHPSAGLPYLADPQGRRIILRGVAASGFEDQAYGKMGTTPMPEYPTDPSAYRGRCPLNTGLSPDPPLCELQASKPASLQSASSGSRDDFAQMRAFGFDLVRLTINWSELEPSPGRYSNTFLDRIAQVVSWARQQGIYVILDMHQDGYSRFVASAAAGVADPQGCSPSNGQDGAPAWAVVTDGQPSCAMFGQKDLNPAMAAAFENFWTDDAVDSNGRAIPRGTAPGPGLQDHFIGALAKLAQRFQDNSTVLGYEIMNEPLPGAAPGSALPITNLYTFSDDYLYPFYRRVVEALTGVRDGLKSCPASDPSGAHHDLAGADASPPPDPCAPVALARVARQAIFFEPTGYSNLVDFAPQLSSPFTSYPNLVYSPHVYTHVFTADTLPGSQGTYPPDYTFAYRNAMADAEAMHAALLATEYGGDPTKDATILAGMTAAQERTLSGSVFWTWKENCYPMSIAACASRWGVYGPPRPAGGGLLPQNGALQPTRTEYLQRAWPVKTSGTLLGYLYDPQLHALVMEATARTPAGGDSVIALPPSLDGPIDVTGKAHLVAISKSTGGWRLAVVRTTAKGSYRVEAIERAWLQGPTWKASWESDLQSFRSQLANPLKPLGEAQARSILDTWISHQSSPLISISESLLLGAPQNDPNA